MITAIQNMNGIPCGQWAVGVCLEIIHVTPHCLSNTAQCKTNLAKSSFFLSILTLVCRTLFSNNSKHSSSRFLQALLSSSSTQHYTSLFFKHFEVLCWREQQLAYSFFVFLHSTTMLLQALLSSSKHCLWCSLKSFA